MSTTTVGTSRQSRTLRAVRKQSRRKHRFLFCGCLFGVLLLVQLVLAVLMVYGDGDDAYYVAISAAAEESGRMYQKIPYTGMHTELDVRHAGMQLSHLNRRSAQDYRHHYGECGEALVRSL